MFSKLKFIFMFILSGDLLSDANQFMGGMLYIRPTETRQKFQVTVRASWRKSSADMNLCEVTSSNLINVDGSLTFKGGCNDKTITPIPLKCTDSSIINNWWSGTYSETYQNSCNASSIEITFKGYQWPALGNGGGTFVLYLKAILTNRPNSNVVNSFPIAVMQPIITLLYGCKQVISIPVFDQDGDTISCRFSNDRVVDECGGVCARLPWITLNKEGCSLKYVPNVAHEGIYAFAFQVEEFIKEDDVNPTSSTPVQFLIEIIKGNMTCEQIPTADDLTFSLDEPVINITLNSPFFSRITAKPKENAPDIAAIDLIGPRGMKKSPLRIDPFDRTGRRKYRNVSWTPTEDQTGEQVVCSTAVNIARLSSPQKCASIFVNYAPTIINIGTDYESSGMGVVPILSIVASIATIIGVPVGIYCTYRRIKAARLAALGSGEPVPISSFDRLD